MRIENRLKRPRRPANLGARLSRISRNWDRLDSMGAAIRNNDFTKHPELDPSQFEGEAYIGMAARNSRFVQEVMGRLKLALLSRREVFMSRLARQVEATFQAVDRGLIPTETAIKAQNYMHEIFKQTALPGEDEFKKRVMAEPTVTGLGQNGFSSTGTLLINQRGERGVVYPNHVKGEAGSVKPTRGEAFPGLDTSPHLYKDVSPTWIQLYLKMMYSWNNAGRYLAAEVKAGSLSRLSADPVAVLRPFLPAYAAESLARFLVEDGVPARVRFIDRLVEAVAARGVAPGDLQQIRAHFRTEAPVANIIDEPLTVAKKPQSLASEARLAIKKQGGAMPRLAPKEAELCRLVTEASAKDGGYATADYLCTMLWPSVVMSVSLQRLSVVRSSLNKKLAQAGRPQIVNREPRGKVGAKYAIVQAQGRDSPQPEIQKKRGSDLPSNDSLITTPDGQELTVKLSENAIKIFEYACSLGESLMTTKDVMRLLGLSDNQEDMNIARGVITGINKAIVSTNWSFVNTVRKGQEGEYRFRCLPQILIDLKPAEQRMKSDLIRTRIDFIPGAGLLVAASPIHDKLRLSRAQQRLYLNLDKASLNIPVGRSELINQVFPDVPAGNANQSLEFALNQLEGILSKEGVTILNVEELDPQAGEPRYCFMPNDELTMALINQARQR